MLLLVACSNPPASTRAPQVVPGAPSSAPSAAAMKAVSRAFLDTSCAPCTNFYEYANGGWMKRATIPPEYPDWGAWREIVDRTQAILRRVLEGAAKSSTATPATDAEKAGVFFAACLDSAAAQAADARPVAAELDRIAHVASATDLQDEIARLQLLNTTALLSVDAEQDAKASTHVILGAYQGGLGLPDREYYLRNDSASTAVRGVYLDVIRETLRLLGDAREASAMAATRILAIETALARASVPLETFNDPYAVYHKMPVGAFDSLAPRLGIRRMLAAWQLGPVDSLNVATPDFFAAASSLLASVPLEEWKVYLRWHYASAASPWLSSAFVTQDFRLAQALTGVRELRPRWKRCLRVTDASMGEAVGQAYVAAAFPPEAKTRALAMVRNLETALQGRIDSLAWMSPATRANAVAKLDAFVNKIGYPDRWRDYSALRITRGPFVTNYFAAATFEAKRQFAKIGRPVDRLEWGMTPATLNAYYNSNLNLFDAAADDASNYGAIGAVIGHEMTHGFDNSGRQFDAQGNLRDWWTATDAAEYTRRAKQVEAQFASYVGIDTLHVNGTRTLPENIADLGGVRVAYAAYLLSLKGGPPPKSIDGFTGPQRFFLAWAQSWRQLQRPEALYTQLLTDFHSPSQWRVNGPLSNMPEFARAFGCKAGDPMVRPDSVRPAIW